jgi:hypothetical protein
MFHASAERLRSWMARIDEALDDVLGDPPVVEHAGGSSIVEHAGDPPIAGGDHPHRTPLDWKRDRRGGSVPPRPAHCLSPVRQGVPVRQSDPAAR